MQSEALCIVWAGLCTQKNDDFCDCISLRCVYLVASDPDLLPRPPPPNKTHTLNHTHTYVHTHNVILLIYTQASYMYNLAKHMHTYIHTHTLELTQCILYMLQFHAKLCNAYDLRY